MEILSLSLNKINSLKDFAHCSKLVELYLRKNQVSDLGQVQYLRNLSGLRVLWLSHNPCADHPHYRPYVIKTLPQLIKLDNAEITKEERQPAKAMNFDSFEGVQANGAGQGVLQKKPSLSVLQQNTNL